MSLRIVLRGGIVTLHRENDERAVDLWILVVPEIIFERCKPNARRTGLSLELGDFEKRKKTRSDLPLLKRFSLKRTSSMMHRTFIGRLKLSI
jgi:hypothetical protein